MAVCWSSSQLADGVSSRKRWDNSRLKATESGLTPEKEDMQDNIVLRVGEPFFVYFRNLRFSEVDVSVCVDGKRRRSQRS